jgi:hypothetical protein
MANTPKVTCPLCERRIGLDRLGAVNSKGERVMQFHLKDKDYAHLGQCLGSYTSVAEASEKGPKQP